MPTVPMSPLSPFQPGCPSFPWSPCKTKTFWIQFLFLQPKWDHLIILIHVKETRPILQGRRVDRHRPVGGRRKSTSEISVWPGSMYWPRCWFSAHWVSCLLSPGTSSSWESSGSSFSCLSPQTLRSQHRQNTHTSLYSTSECWYYYCLTFQTYCLRRWGSSEEV